MFKDFIKLEIAEFRVMSAGLISKQFWEDVIINNDIVIIHFHLFVGKELIMIIVNN